MSLSPINSEIYPPRSPGSMSPNPLFKIFMALLVLILILVTVIGCLLLDWSGSGSETLITPTLTPDASGGGNLTPDNPGDPTSSGSGNTQPTSTPLPGSTTINNKDGMTLVYIPGGEFLMGSDVYDADEKPSHTVYVDGFWIDRTEVTNQMYSLCVTARVCQPPLDIRSSRQDIYYGDARFWNYPVIRVDWFMAKAYCEWVERRLPTEAEWEKAARGVPADPMDVLPYPWGKGISCNNANYLGCVGDTTGVGNYSAGQSPYDVYDMSGNVWEWVSSLYKPYPYDAKDGREDLTVKDIRVFRGGGWNSYGQNLRSAKRNSGNPSFNDGYLGFRCANQP